MGGRPRVLITGAAGFIGRHTTDRLMRDGFDVTAFDRSPVPSVRWIEGDLRDGGAVRDAARDQDVICHIGAVGDVYLAAREPATAASVNVTGSAHVAAAAEENGCRIVYASTWEVYGPPEYTPIDEDHPCRPDHPYNITKLAGEQMLLAADTLDQVPVLALRLGTAYGPGLRANSVFRIFIDRARRHEPITIMGDGSQGRQFTHVSDIARAFSLACETKLHGLSLNVVAPETISIKELADLVTQRFPTEIRFSEARPGDPAPAFVSAERAGRLLGWSPEIRFDRGVADLLASMPPS